MEERHLHLAFRSEQQSRQLSPATRSALRCTFWMCAFASDMPRYEFFKRRSDNCICKRNYAVTVFSLSVACTIRYTLEMLGRCTPQQSALLNHTMLTYELQTFAWSMLCCFFVGFSMVHQRQMRIGIDRWTASNRSANGRDGRSDAHNDAIIFAFLPPILHVLPFLYALIYFFSSTPWSAIIFATSYSTLVLSLHLCHLFFCFLRLLLLTSFHSIACSVHLIAPLHPFNSPFFSQPW